MQINIVKGILIVLVFLIPKIYNAQLRGYFQGYKDGKRSPLEMGKIKFLNSRIVVHSNEDGTFEVILPKILPDTVVFSHYGYISDTIVVDKSDRFGSINVVLYSSKLIPEVIIGLKKQSHSILRLKTLHVEELSQDELKKAACCNISESFETNASVDVNMTDAVSGAKKIQMMGLDGVYTQIQMENIPYLRGLQSAFGLHSIPGTWIESIQITKGTGNVVNGYESMSGLVNLELKKPQHMESLFLNFYGNIMGRAEINLNSSHQISEKWSTSFMTHVSGIFFDNDHNDDGFLDMPTGNDVAFFNRWAYEGDKMESQFGVHLYTGSHLGGQFKESVFPLYQLKRNNSNIDLFAKTGFFFKKVNRSLGLLYNFKIHQLDNQFGNRYFEGFEKRGYFNMIYDDCIGSKDHAIKSGFSFVYSDIDQNLSSDSSLSMIQYVPGAFIEYTLTSSRANVIVGGRYDYHNLYGSLFSPRTHMKFIVSEYTDFRLTAGKSWRVPNMIIDNISLLANQKSWVYPDEIIPEISWNAGGSLVQRFRLFDRESSISLDYYHTRFQNQLVADRDINTNIIVFRNLKNLSYSNAIQAEMAISPIRGLDLRFAYKYLDVKAFYNNKYQQQVLLPKHRGFMNLAYVTRNKRWALDLTPVIIGSQRLPALGWGAAAVNYSPSYFQLNGQITYKFKSFDVYLGGENITNYRQQNPIIDAQNPFGSTFDATQVWGPIIGTNVYLGIRLELEKKEKEE